MEARKRFSCGCWHLSPTWNCSWAWSIPSGTIKTTPTSCQNKGNRKLHKEKSRLGREQREGRSRSHVASVTVTIPFIINQQNAAQLQKIKLMRWVDNERDWKAGEVSRDKWAMLAVQRCKKGQSHLEIPSWTLPLPCPHKAISKCWNKRLCLFRRSDSALWYVKWNTDLIKVKQRRG